MPNLFRWFAKPHIKVGNGQAITVYKTMDVITYPYPWISNGTFRRLWAQISHRWHRREQHWCPMQPQMDINVLPGYMLEHNALHWRHNGRDSVSNHQPHDCLFNRLYQRKHQSSVVRGIHRWPVNSPHKGPVPRKCFHLMTSSCGAAAIGGLLSGCPVA